MPDRALAVAAPLDHGFRPLAFVLRQHLARCEGSSEAVTFALEASGGSVSHFTLPLPSASGSLAPDTLRLAERVLKFLLWQRGAQRVWVAGAPRIAAELRRAYAASGERAFDAEFLGKVFEKPGVEFVDVAASELPLERQVGRSIGGHLDGCRIGFDAGGSDRKVAALIDGKEVFSTETVWQPKLESDPAYHFAGIDDSIRLAAAHLPRIDAIGVSSAGVYVDNRTMIASLFRRVPSDLFEAHIKNIYLDIAKKWGDVPIAVANDGDVTALAGALELGEGPVLGIAMGTSQAAGYVDRRGLITGWLNELAFAPVDASDSAPVDAEWSGDAGTGASYFSQDAAIRLAKVAGVELESDAAPGEKLRQLQEKLRSGDRRVGAIFETIGVYLGYALLLYSHFYELKHVLLLGRVTSGQGGALLVEKAREVLAREAPDLAERVTIHLPDEAKRRVGQSIAAASLPRLREGTS